MSLLEGAVNTTFNDSTIDNIGGNATIATILELDWWGLLTRIWWALLHTHFGGGCM